MAHDTVIMVAAVTYCEADVSPTCEAGWFVHDTRGDAHGPFETALDAQIFLEEELP